MNIQFLKTELKKYCHEAVIDRKIRTIDGFDEDLKNALDAFLNTGDYPDIEINGWTIEKIMLKTRENVIEAFIYFDMMQKNPDFADGFKYLGFGRK